jgi:hypothetical protein
MFCNNSVLMTRAARRVRLAETLTADTVAAADGFRVLEGGKMQSSAGIQALYNASAVQISQCSPMLTQLQVKSHLSTHKEIRGVYAYLVPLDKFRRKMDGKGHSWGGSRHLAA